MFNKNFYKEPTDRQKIGEVGETYACKHIEDSGHSIIERNYLKKWGEIDIVSKKGSVIHFIEVKTVTRDLSDVTHVTNDTYNPEDNMHPWKLQRLGRAIQSYLLDRDVSDETEWQFDLITVYVDKDKRLIDIKLLSDIVL